MKGGAIFIESEKPEFTYAILGLNSSSKDIPQRTHRVQILPGCKISDEDLRGLGFSRIFGVSYMVLENPPDWRLAEGLSVDEVGGSQSSMDVFSETQAKGFSENEADYQAWHPFLKAANDRNLMNSHQHFYVGYLKSEPVGTVLTVQAKNLLGIYAVATLARHRKAGIGTTVMERAIRDARAPQSNDHHSSGQAGFAGRGFLSPFGF